MRPSRRYEIATALFVIAMVSFVIAGSLATAGVMLALAAMMFAASRRAASINR